jgi:hypothetical protein
MCGCGVSEQKIDPVWTMTNESALFITSKYLTVSQENNVDIVSDSVRCQRDARCEPHTKHQTPITAKILFLNHCLQKNIQHSQSTVETATKTQKHKNTIITVIAKHEVARKGGKQRTGR